MKRLLLIIGAIALLVRPAAAQSPAPAQLPAPGSARPFEILDNSFLVEEAFNQEPGIFQNIVLFTRAEDESWAVAFTQEWPFGSQRHQLSYTVPLQDNGSLAVGDVALNYRYQALSETSSWPAISPRLTLLLPTGQEDAAGAGSMGFQFNLPVSKQLGDFYVHANAGATLLPSVEFAGETTSLVSPAVAASVIFRLAPMLNLMLESGASWDEFAVDAGVTDRESGWFVAPGVRGGWNLGESQLILGAALAFERRASATENLLVAYFSYELPFRR